MKLLKVMIKTILILAAVLYILMYIVSTGFVVN